MLPPAAGGPWAGKAALESRGWKQPPPETRRDPVGPPAGSVPPAAALLPSTAPVPARRGGMACCGAAWAPGSWLLGRVIPLCSLLVQLLGLLLGCRCPPEP